LHILEYKNQQNMPKIIGIIPARFASTRFPGKPLVEIKGKSMIRRVYEQVLKSNLDAVYVATDNHQILAHVESFGGNCLLTSELHQSGTDRCNECALLLQLDQNDVLINIQGDEPFIKAEQINLLTLCFNDDSIGIATLIKQIDSLNELQSNSIPKVIKDKNDDAIYFSRSIIPFPAKKTMEELITLKTYFKHIGIYAYRTKILNEIAALPPSIFEQTESLEQLRWIENGYKIKTAITTHETIAIDTPDDLVRALKYAEENKI
jgi:3-deoxy-manno-octulosonate cytidylyltransferase (CMP-KDO synthetase)